MKIRLIVLISVIGIYNNVNGQPETMWQLLLDGSILKWAYAGGDEFNENHINSEIWMNSYPWGRSLVDNHELEYYTDGDNYEFSFNSNINSGTLKLVAREESLLARAIPYLSDSAILTDGEVNRRWWNYTSGMVFSKQQFKYGLFEIRFKTPYGQGFWPAFWLYGDNPPDEIDVFEMKGGETNKVKSGCICNSTDCGGKWFEATGNFDQGFNTMRVDWEPNFIIWSLNNTEYYIKFHDFGYPMSVIANLAIASDEGPFDPGPNSSTPFPSSFEIDFIRVWKRLDCDQSLNICNYSQSPTDPTTLTGGNITIGGENCNTTVNYGEYLNLIATDFIHLKPGFLSKDGSNFSAKIVECPGPQMKSNINTNSLTIKKHSIDQQQVQNDNDSIVHEKEVLMTVYPNPAKGFVNIEIPAAHHDHIKNIQLINSTGVIVYSEYNIIEEFFRIDISSYSKGVYFFKVLINNTEFVEKFVIE